MSPVFANVHDESGLPPTPEKIAATQRTNVEGQQETKAQARYSGGDPVPMHPDPR